MAGLDTIPDLQVQKPDGSLYNRLEMEQQIRETWKKPYHMRIKANKVYGLQKAPSFDMKEAVLRHWVLDKLIERGQCLGDIVGVNVQNYDDDNELRQFVQRLTALIEVGQALAPKEGEGVDMSQVPGPPPGIPQNGGQPQQAFQPPAPPMGVGAPPGPPGYAPPQQAFVPPGAPTQQFVPPGPPQQGGFQPPQQQAYQPPQAPQQMMPPGYQQSPQQVQQAPQQMAPQGLPPGPPMQPPGPPVGQQAAPPTTGRRGRGKAAENTQAAPQAAPVPPMGVGGFQPPGAPQQQFAPPQAQQGVQMPPQGFQMPQTFQPTAQPQQVAQQAPQQSDLAPLVQNIANQVAQLIAPLNQQIAQLQYQVSLSNLAITALSRGVWREEGNADIEAWLVARGVPLPPR